MTNVNNNNNIGNAWNNLWKEAEELAEKAGAAVVDAGQEFIENTSDRFSKAGDTFAEQGLVPGLIETADALSVGSRVADLADAVGLVESDAAKEYISAATNTVTNPLVAIKDMFECGEALRNPKAELNRQVAKKGYVQTGLSPVPSANDDFVKVNLAQKMGRVFDGELKLHGKGKQSESVLSLPAEERDIEAILRDPNLSFEDRVAMVLAHVCHEMQEEIEEELKKLTDMGKGSKVGVDTKALAKAGQSLCGSNEGNVQDNLSDFMKTIEPVADVLMPVVAPLAASAVATIPGAGPFLAPLTPMALSVAKDLAFSSTSSNTQGHARMQMATNGTAVSDGNAKGEGADGRALQMEKIKQLNNRLSQMQQALSNVLNNMHRTSMNSVRQIAA